MINPITKLMVRFTPLTTSNVDIVWLYDHRVSHCDLREGSLAYYASCKGKLVGFFSVRSFHDNPEARYLQWIEVVEPFKNKGYGTLLLNRALTVGFETVKMLKKNQGAIGFLQHHGFTIEDEDHQSVFMRKPSSENMI